MGGIVRTIFGGPSKQKSSQQSSSSSYNQAYGQLSNALSPTLGYTSSAGNMMGSLLGLGGPSSAPSQSSYYGSGGTSRTSPFARQPSSRLFGMRDTLPDFGNFRVMRDSVNANSGGAAGNQTSALENWANSGGMKFLMDQGVNAIEGSRAARGMLQSGSTAKALQKFGQGLGSTYLNQYMQQLLDYAKLGQGSAGIIGSVGGVSNSSGTGSSKGEGEKKGILPMIAGAVAGGA